MTVHDPIAAGEERPKRGKMVMFTNEHGADRANADIERGDIRPNFEADQQHLSPKTTTMSQLGLASTHSLSSESRPTPQYTLQARRRIHHGSVWGCLTAATSDYSTSADAISNGIGGCCHPNRVINQFFHWTFRTSFATLLVAFIVMFVLATMVFAGFILWAAADQPQCIASSAFSVAFASISTRIAGEASTYGQRMADAYALSWTTFSTVGYGLIYPASTNEFDEQELCAGMILVCSVEGKFSSKGCRKTLYNRCYFQTDLTISHTSHLFINLTAFLGMVFSGLCAAVLVAKVNRTQAHAPVLFSDPIVIRYGLGRSSAQEMDEASTVDEDGDSDMSTEGGMGEKCWPVPVLEFRILNKLANRFGGEIMDCTLHASASIDAANYDHSILNAVNPQVQRRRNKRSKRRNVRGHTEKKSAKKGHNRDISLYMGEGVTLTADSPLRPRSRKQAEQAPAVETVASSTGGSDSEADDAALLNPTLIEMIKQEHQEIIEDSSKLVPRRIFSKLFVDHDSHPFFKRVWTVQIELNAESPLLTKEARNLVIENGGFWPDSLNNYQSIRKSISFNSILISLSGTSNTNASTVFAHKVYSRSDLFVGFQFANILYRNETGALMVDNTLFNDCLEQYGGGAEPLNVVGDEEE